MKLWRVLVPLILAMISGASMLAPQRHCFAQETQPDTARQMDRLSEHLNAIEARLEALETRLNSLQIEKPTKTGPDDQSTVVEERIEDLDQKLRIIERRRELEQEKLAEESKTATKVNAGKDGFSLSSADKDFQLRFNGYLQADSVFFAGDSSPAVDSFRIGRARPVFQGTIYKYFDFRIMPDFGGGQAVLQDLHLDLTYLPAAKLRFGKFKSPMGLEVLQGDTDLTFIYRAFPSILAPGRDVGAQVYGDVHGGVVSYAVAILNGVQDGTSSDVDTNDGKDLVARVFVQPFKDSSQGLLKGLGIGLGGSSGNQHGTLASYKTSGQAVFFTFASGVTSDGYRYRYSPQAYYYAGQLGILAEYVASSQEVRKSDNLLRIQNHAWQVASSYAIGGKPSYRAVSPKRTFNPKQKEWGALEFAGRYSRMTLDEDAFSGGFADLNKSAKEAHEFTLGVNWYMAKMIKFVVNYEQISFKGGSAQQGNRPTEHAILSRFQIGF